MYYLPDQDKPIAGVVANVNKIIKDYQLEHPPGSLMNYCLCSDLRHHDKLIIFVHGTEFGEFTGFLRSYLDGDKKWTPVSNHFNYTQQARFDFNNIIRQQSPLVQLQIPGILQPHIILKKTGVLKNQSDEPKVLEYIEKALNLINQTIDVYDKQSMAYLVIRNIQKYCIQD